MNAFITGSYAYGNPTLDSDLDLVIRVDPIVAGRLRQMSEAEKTVRFGRVNLILCESDLEYETWAIGTYALQRKGEKPDKHKAKEFFDGLREMVGIVDKSDSGSR